MATPSSIPATPEDRYPEPCPHCYGGFVFEPNEDELIDEPHECPACLGRAVKTTREERKAMKAERDLDMHHSSLERAGG